MEEVSHSLLFNFQFLDFFVAISFMLNFYFLLLKVLGDGLVRIKEKNRVGIGSLSYLIIIIF